MEASSGMSRAVYLLMTASANVLPENLDLELMAFLKAKFPTEVKAKQRENERAAGVDHYGEGFDRCALM